MIQKIRITTKAAEFEQRKKEYLAAGYQIEAEQPVPVNGLCFFTAIRHTADQEP